MHDGLPHHCVFPHGPLSWSNDPTNTTGQEPHPVFHTRSLFWLWSWVPAEGAESAARVTLGSEASGCALGGDQRGEIGKCGLRWDRLALLADVVGCARRV